MIRGASFRLLHNAQPADVGAHLDRLVAAGCNAVAIIPHSYVSLTPNTPNLSAPPKDYLIPYFIYPDIGQDSSHPFQNTPAPALVYWTIKAAQARGLSVLLKPHIDSYQAGWRGNISVLSQAPAFAWSYRNRFLAPYVSIARETNCDLCMGTELYTVTKELKAQFWIDMADWVRAQGFHGPLTYAANWGWAGDAEYRRLETLWPHLDSIGIDAYFPLVPPGYTGPLDKATLLAGWHRRGEDYDWCPRIDDDLIALQQYALRPLCFTEIGYANHTLAAENPGRDPLPTDVRDDTLQLLLAQVARERWEGVPNFAGYYVWEAAFPGVVTSEISHNILERPAGAAWFAERTS